MARGCKPNLERRKQAAELRARGLSLAEVGRRMGCTRQAVHQLLGFRGPAPRPRKAVTCPACGGAVGTAPTARDRAPALCLACLEKWPYPPEGRSLRTPHPMGKTPPATLFLAGRGLPAGQRRLL
jgi:hypothetical protein